MISGTEKLLIDPTYAELLESLQLAEKIWFLRLARQIGSMSLSSKGQF